ncbi:MAG: 16S rRNA (uracil(1498)-N(3))-methyltransferase [bacterium]|nr:16S rRNA (uracil(1498)-N(3))-methyltransferase [bacterium]
MIIESLIKHKVSIFSEIPSEVQIQNNYLFWVHNELFNYLKNSLRLKAKDNIVVFDSYNYINYCRYIVGEFINFKYQKDKKGNFVEINVKKFFQTKLSNPIINLYVVPPKNRYLNDLVANVVQLPVDTLYFFPSEYMVVNIKEITKKIDKIKDIIFWNSIYVSKYYNVNFKVIDNFKEFVEHLKFYDWIIVFHPYTDLTVSDFFKLTKINELFNNFSKKQDLIQKIKEEKFKIAITIGPEGGFSNKEINIFKEHNAFILRFDFIENIIKTELAANIGVSQLLTIFNYLIKT